MTSHVELCNSDSFVFCIMTGMKSAMKTILQISSISSIHQRGGASLTAESMCWDIFSRYSHHTTLVYIHHIRITKPATYSYSTVNFMLQGGAPSPFDRNFGTKLGVRAIQWISEKLTENFRDGTVLCKSVADSKNQP